jgi:MinD-like ATPase involved in chromosome partitioning or flagellar assembly
MYIDIGHYTQIKRYCRRTDVENLWVLPSEEIEDQLISGKGLILQDDKKSSYLERCFSNLVTLRFAFDYVLLDCPALSISEETTFLAPETDGVIVVVEADNTKREQIQSAQKMIENADGKFLGFVLNKRQYPVPNWIYKRL